MKKMIVILGTIILGILIVTTMILSNTGLKGSAEDVTNKGTSSITEMITDMNK